MFLLPLSLLLFHKIIPCYVNAIFLQLFIEALNKIHKLDFEPSQRDEVANANCEIT